MRRRTLLVALAAVLTLAAVLAPHASFARPSSAPVPKPAIRDVGQSLDVNQISMRVTNLGSFAYDVETGNAGFEYPKGSGKNALFAGSDSGLSRAST